MKEQPIAVLLFQRLESICGKKTRELRNYIKPFIIPFKIKGMLCDVNTG